MNNEQTKTCYLCGNEVNVSNGVQWGSYFYCDECFKDTKCKVDGYHHPSLEIKFRKLNDEDTKEYLGIELETTKGTGCFYQSDHVDDILYIRKNFKNVGRSINFETDSSIGNGKEMVFFPMTYSYIKENQDEIKSILNYLTSTGNYSHDKGKCGLHIHVSKDSLGDTTEEIQKTIEKLMLFVETYRPKMEKFARRKHNEFSHYNSYTIPFHKENSSDTCFETDDYFKSGKMLYEINKADYIGHSSVINPSTSTGVTVEFRMFRGTLRFETFMATIEFIHNLVNVCKENQVSKISWNKVINYGGDYIKEYNDSLNLIDDGLYLRDYTNQIEEIISKREQSKKEVVDKYKKDLNDISNSIIGLVNEPIDFTSDNNIIRDTLRLRNEVYEILRSVLITDDILDGTANIYRRLKTMATDYTPTCKSNLNAIKNTLNNYNYYNLTETTKGHVQDTIALIDEKITEISNMATSTQGEY